MITKTLSIIVLLIISAAFGYGLGYNNSYKLQNANMRSTEISDIGVSCKLLELVSNDESDRALVLINSAIQSDVDYLKNLISLRKEAESFHLVEANDFTLIDFIEARIADTESDILEMPKNDKSICEKVDFGE